MAKSLYRIIATGEGRASATVELTPTQAATVEMVLDALGNDGESEPWSPGVWLEKIGD
jgi:hypothetical protein